MYKSVNKMWMTGEFMDFFLLIILFMLTDCAMYAIVFFQEFVSRLRKARPNWKEIASSGQA